MSVLASPWGRWDRLNDDVTGDLGANQAVSAFQYSVLTRNALLVSSWGLAARFSVKQFSLPRPPRGAVTVGPPGSCRRDLLQHRLL